MTVRGFRNVAREVFLTSGAVLGVLCIVATVAGIAFGVMPLVFRSGSMSPAIETGDLAISRTVPASQIETGDIVSVITSTGARVTHRVVNVAENGEQRQLTLQGDANQEPDAEVYTVSEVERVWFDIPKAGYVVDAATGPVGIFVLGLYVSGMLVLVFRRRPPEPGDDDPAGRRAGTRRAERRPRRNRAEGSSGRRAARVVAIVSVVHLVAGAPAFASPWTDSVTVGNSTVANGVALSAFTVPKPAISSCVVTGTTLGQKTATITFAANLTQTATPDAYLEYTAVIVETGQSLTVGGTGATRTVQFSASLLSTVVNQTYHVRITARLPSPNQTWTSVSANQPVTVALLGVGLTCGTAT